MLRSLTYPCPHCAEIQEIGVDPTAGETQEYVEDCWVCCNPIQLKIVLGAEDAIALNVEPASWQQ